MSDQPYLKWWPANWRSDRNVRQCSLAARGLWIEFINIMHECEPYGHLLIGGRKPTAKELARDLGVTRKQIEHLTAELVERGVASMREDGVVFCRKMVRDKHRRQMNQVNGKLGGNPQLTSSDIRVAYPSRLYESDKAKLEARSKKPKAKDQKPEVLPPRERPAWKGQTFAWFAWMEAEFQAALKLAKREDFELHGWRERVDAEWAGAGVKPAPDEAFKALMARLIADVPLQTPTLKARPTAAPQPTHDVTWATECRALHGRTCNGQMAHALRMDAERAKVAESV